MNIRTHGRILTRIWQDSDFRHASAGAQRVYMLLLSQPNLGHSGVISVTVRRWAALCGDTDATSIETALQELHERRFIVIDWDTDELVVCGTLERDGIEKQPQIWHSVAAEVQDTNSPVLQAAIQKEMARLRISNDLKPKTVKKHRNVSKQRRYQILHRDNFICRYCGANDSMVVDHVIPVSAGGTNDPSNLVTACFDCNAGKAALLPDSTPVADVPQSVWRGATDDPWTGM